MPPMLGKERMNFNHCFVAPCLMRCYFYPSCSLLTISSNSILPTALFEKRVLVGYEA